ncbi:competence type IV pilus minor pilin ComGD [Fredinandcohnia sp. 179-A 10B2 NHS]|uniref:competence type IV pilus minor pilin ComGD n=1 Tax=Fredinandcohnia sp. 179-A 10B2 NHS TaxID=3235176 RepID=UPI0039A19874
MQKVNNKGFTLIETLLVLFIFAVITSISLLHVKPLQESKRIEQFLEQLQNDIFYAQQYAISHSDTSRIIFSVSEPYYLLSSGSKNINILTRRYDQSIQFSQSTLGTILQFNSQGNIQKAGSIKVKYQDETYTITFLLGKGRFYVSKM